MERRIKVRFEGRKALSHQRNAGGGIETCDGYPIEDALGVSGC